MQAEEVKKKRNFHCFLSIDAGDDDIFISQLHEIFLTLKLLVK